MRINVAIILVTLCLLPMPVRASEDGPDALLGTWNSEDSKAKIEIFHCSSHYCGKIVRLGMPEYPPDDKGGMRGKPRVDRDNPNPDLRSRPLLGLQFMEGFEYAGNNTWEKGTIYDPESGKTYKSKITLASPTRLEIRGYVGIPLFGKSTVWLR